MTVLVNLRDDQIRVMLDYADANKMTLDDLIEDLIERIEDEMDAKLADEAYDDYLQNPETISHEEIMKEFGPK